MVISGSTKILKDGTRERHTYYACGAWKNKRTAVCNSNLIDVEKANKKVFKEISRVINNELILKQIVDNINNDRKNSIKPSKEELEVLEKQMIQLDKKKEKSFEAFEAEIISKEDFSERMAKLNSEKEDIVERITTLKIDIDNKDSEPVVLEM